MVNDFFPQTDHYSSRLSLAFSELARLDFLSVGRAKASWLASVPDSERKALKARFRGVGFHSEKRSGVRTGEFRSLPPKIQEELAGTKHSTLSATYDHVSPDDMREAMSRARNRPVSGRETTATASS